MDRLKLFFSFILLTVFKMVLCFGIIIFLIIFSPVFLFINNKSFYYCMDELYKTLK